MKIHPAKALETAVFTLASLSAGSTVNIRHTDITVTMKGSWYYIQNGSTQYSARNRMNAIDTIEQILTN